MASWDHLFGKPLLSQGRPVQQGQHMPENAADAFGAHYDYTSAEYIEGSHTAAITGSVSDAKWESLQQMSGSQFPPVRDPTEMTIPTCSALRIRREQNGRDSVNSRVWDNFHATPPTQVSSSNLQNTTDPKYMDMNPVGSRKSGAQFRHQLEYMPDNNLPPAKNSTNPFLQRMDAEGSEARNIVREFRDAVSEDNRERDLESSKRLTERQFQDRWLPQQAAEEAASLQAYELLRPKQYFNY